MYGSEGSLNLHIKIKHNGGNKTDRERLAKSLVEAHLNGEVGDKIELVDLNLPPGTLTKIAEKRGVLGRVEEDELLQLVQQKLAEKQCETVQQLQNEQKRAP